ncbi:MAG: T9SS type A sorting domain-containing protein [Chitinophagales bacterium]|nr:T9SS type A sorting domain-containing protein [Chitinophagaceae bacterium]MCB9065993.1 T9SS type A sorting domain-containing protein [Chitinophagales bacterium]
MQKTFSTLVLLICLASYGNISKAQYLFELFNINHRTGSDPGSVIVVDTFLFFTANDGIHGREPWICDGTQAGTKIIKDINPGTTGSLGGLIAANNGKVYFTATDYSSSPFPGSEPWVTDGTATGTQMIKDIYTGTKSSISFPEKFTSSAGNVYFFADDGTHGKELWVTDGTANGTYMVKDINPGTGHSTPGGFIEYNSKTYFGAYDSTHGVELWVTDGTTNGTQLLIDLEPGRFSSNISNLFVYNNKLYFSAISGSGTGIYESDGTVNGTKFVTAGYWNDEIVQFNGKLYIGAGELYSFDGTPTGFQLIKDINPATNQYSSPSQLTVVGNQLFFTADDGVHNEELWVSDGTTNGTHLVKNISTHPVAGSTPLDLIAYANKLFFIARDTNMDYELYVSDGTVNGTKMIKGKGPTMASPGPQGTYAVCNNALYFANYDTAGYEMWKLTDTAYVNSLDTTNNPPTNMPTIQTVSDNITVAPNPAHDKVTIGFDKAYSNAQLSIVDLSGKVILNKPIDAAQKVVEVSLPEMSTGVYILNIHHDEGVITERLLIE